MTAVTCGVTVGTGVAVTGVAVPKMRTGEGRVAVGVVGVGGVSGVGGTGVAHGF